MIQKTLYIAFDGKEFDDEYDCADYEIEQMMLNAKGLRMYDENGNLTDDAERCDYLFCPTEEDAAAYAALSEYIGLESPWGNEDPRPGAWIWSNHWENYEDIRSDLIRQIEQYDRMFSANNSEVQQ